MTRHEVSLDDAPFGALKYVTDTEFTSTGLAEGAHTYRVRAVDAAGNRTEPVATATWVIDRTPPTIDPWSGDLTVEATSAAGAVVNYPPAHAQDNGTTAPRIAYFPTSGSTLPIGETIVRITATDVAGNVGTGSFLITVTARKVDALAPIVAFTAPTATKAQDPFTLAGTVRENVALQSLRLSCNGAPIAFDTPPVFVPNQTVAWQASNFTPAKNGAATYIIEAIDDAGHVSTAKKIITWLESHPELAGTYVALLAPAGPRSPYSTGLVSVTVTARGAFSGRLRQSYHTYPFTGRLLLDGAAPGGALYSFVAGALSLSVSAEGISGTLHNGAIVATFAARPNVRGANAVPPPLLNFPAAAPRQGIYSVVFPAGRVVGTINPNIAPKGDGYASLTLQKSSGALLTGFLADGTRYSAAGMLRADRSLPLFTAYSAHSVFSGALTFDDQPDSDVTGPDFVRTRYIGSDVAIHAVGTKHRAPDGFNFGQGSPDAVHGNATLVFGDDLFSSPIGFDPATGAVKLIPSPTPATCLLSPASGLFSGTVRHGARSDRFGGILLNKGRNRGGFRLLSHQPDEQRGCAKRRSLPPAAGGVNARASGLTRQPISRQPIPALREFLEQRARLCLHLRMRIGQGALANDMVHIRNPILRSTEHIPPTMRPASMKFDDARVAAFRELEKWCAERSAALRPRAPAAGRIALVKNFTICACGDLPPS